MHNKKKKILAAVLLPAAGVFLLLFGIRAYHRQTYDYIDLPIVLSNEEDIVKTVREGLTGHNEQITVRFTARGNYHDQITVLADSLVEKALEPTRDPKQGDYIRFQYGGYDVRYSNPENTEGKYDYTIKIRPKYYTNETQEESVDKAVKAFLDSEKSGTVRSDYEKIKAAHDYLVSKCDYDWRNILLSHRHIKSTAYGALVNNEASCQGYSVAMYRLLMESGVRCRVIRGYATSPETGEREYHAWNLVRADGKWYNVDVSWDDQTDSYDYFMKSDSSFSDHVRDPEFDTQDFRSSYSTDSLDYDTGYLTLRNDD